MSFPVGDSNSISTSLTAIEDLLSDTLIKQSVLGSKNDTIAVDVKFKHAIHLSNVTESEDVKKDYLAEIPDGIKDHKNEVVNVSQLDSRRQAGQPDDEDWSLDDYLAMDAIASQHLLFQEQQLVASQQVL